MTKETLEQAKGLDSELRNVDEYLDNLNEMANDSKTMLHLTKRGTDRVLIPSEYRDTVLNSLRNFYKIRRDTILEMLRSL